MRASFKPNTDEEEAAIQRGIAQDPDNPEWTEEMFRNARPASEMMPPEIYNELVASSERARRRGPGRKPSKVQVTVRLDADVIAGLRGSGPGWQGRMNAALRRLIDARLL